ncbi:AAA family ATPase [Endozoicomonas gorgoniicola]|uniref:AAA family ATPase n=1 Tax=Endozoicomonas gorgoniicola TaxID=1234144 RepID=A0ABT3MTC3_9GAMM|nr:AAA family ATPase [Endozoicomonas gorgoniicola]MCW7552639.1 AAA family ATPase [Endozoicomonas gorgoniicola]
MRRSIKEKVEQLVEKLGVGLHEREEIVAVALLGALSGQNTFLYGPPGTAKSLISRRISCAFQDSQYFEYLMNRFSTPEEVFGPVSLKALKEDKYTRKTNGYLPTADFAFLDEIWKSSPAVLNTLLTLTNERLFRNGDETQEAPLKALFAASNETPAEGQGLDALYDRFTLRMLVPPLQSREKFESLINGEPVSAEIEVPQELRIDNATWKEIIQGIHSVELSIETLTIISLIRIALGEMEEPVYVSDRRWQKAAIVMKASAMLCGRKQSNHSDALLLRHCLWIEESNRETMIKIVEDAVKDCGFSTDLDMARLDKEKEKLDQEIHKELFHSHDVYDTKTLAGKKYFHVTRDIDNRRSNGEKIDFYIGVEKMKSMNNFHPVDRSGNEMSKVTCTFDAQGSCSIKYKYNYHGHNTLKNYVPKVIFHKGDKKDDINGNCSKLTGKSTSTGQRKLS